MSHTAQSLAGVTTIAMLALMVLAGLLRALLLTPGLTPAADKWPGAIVRWVADKWPNAVGAHAVADKWPGGAVPAA